MNNQGKGKKNRRQRIHWEKLDNTANLFPAIAGHNRTNVYRISVVLRENVDAMRLQQALDMVLPRYDTFRVRMRRGIFWHYFETNDKPAPNVLEEANYPCSYIEPYANNNYLFRVTYYKKRINLEVFHVLADGMGSVNFLKEITYQYLRLTQESLSRADQTGFSDETSLNTEDSYLKHYKKSHKKGYQTKRAVEVKGEKFGGGEISVFHGYMPLTELKEVCRKAEASINEYLTAVFLYSIYKEYLHGQPSDKPLAACIPVDLRPFFDSLTTRNFFVMVSAVFLPEREDMPLQDVVDLVKQSLRGQINKEHLEELFSYNVANQKNIFLRSVPIFVKLVAMRMVYRSSAKANTTTVTNIGKIQVGEKYRPFIRNFSVMISRSVGQNIKGAICSYNDLLSFTITSVFTDVSIQRRFFKTLSEQGIRVIVESNGVTY